VPPQVEAGDSIAPDATRNLGRKANLSSWRCQGGHCPGSVL